ncbi:MAG: energy transducer TonB [Bacteroidia bacterium]
MKNLLLLITLFISSISFAQKDTTKQKEAPLTIVEQMPLFKGGDKAMSEYIQKNIKYPKEAHKLKAASTCYINFVVEQDGAVTEVRVLRGITDCPTCDQEAIRVVSSMPNWIPGKQNGRVVRVMFNLPISFKP